MSTLATLGIYVITLIISIVSNFYFIKWRVSNLEKWKDSHDNRFNKMSQEVAYLSGRMNGGHYKHGG